MKHDSPDHYRDADFLAALHENAIVACYEDLPEWTFVFVRKQMGTVKSLSMTAIAGGVLRHTGTPWK